MATSKEKSGASRKSESEKRADEAKKAEEARKAAEVAEADEEEDEDDEEDEEEEPLSAVPARPARRRAAEPVDEAEEEEEVVDDEDPYWWTPHVALSAIVIVGILGFFGLFNKALGPYVPKPLPASALESDEPDNKATAPTPQPASQPQARPRPGATMNPMQPDAPTFGARHLLVQYKGSMRAGPTITRTKEEAKARATEAMNKAKKPGAKFEDIVKEYSDEPGADKRGGDLGTFRKGQMVPQFQDAVEKLKVGEVSPLVETPFGYHVILRTK